MYPGRRQSSINTLRILTLIIGTIWNRVSPWIDKRQYAFTTISVAISILVLCDFVTKDKIDSQLDLQLLSGKLSHYSFTEGRRGSMQYYLWLMEYPGTFQIPAYYIDFFNKEEFIKRASPYSNVVLKIAKSRLKDLNKGKRIAIFELTINNMNYLDSNLTIATEKKPFPLYIGFTFMLAGIVFFIFRKRFPSRPRF